MDSDIPDFRLPIANWPDRWTAIGNRQLPIGTHSIHRLPRTVLTSLPLGGLMINYSEKGGGVTFQVYVVPRASHSEIAGEHNGALRVRLAAPPADGAANRELIAVLAKALHVSRSGVAIDSGHTSRTKRVTVSQANAEILNAIGLSKSR